MNRPVSEDVLPHRPASPQSQDAMGQSRPGAGPLDLGTVLSALANSQRLRIVAQLDESPGIPCWQFWGDMNKSTRSHHLKILRQAGIIHSWREASEVLNCLRRDELDRQFPKVLDSLIAAWHANSGEAH